MSGIFDADLFAAVLRISTPVLLVAMGGLFSMRAKLFNFGVEGFMLIGCFFSIFIVDKTNNLWLGLLGGAVAGMLISIVYGIAVIHLKASAIIASVGLNLLGVGLTTFLLRPIFNTSGAYRPPNIQAFPIVEIPFIKDIPFIGDVLSGHTPLVYIALLLVIVSQILMFKTPLGLAIQSVGDNIEAARTAGINPNKILWLTVLWGGFFSGLGGAHLAIGYVSAFSQEMTAGRGYTAFTAIVFGAENPLFTFLACLVFGFADALGIRLEIQGFGLHPSLIKTFPFILAVAVLSISSAIRIRRRKSAQQLL